MCAKLFTERRKPSDILIIIQVTRNLRFPNYKSASYLLTPPSGKPRWSHSKILLKIHNFRDFQEFNIIRHRIEITRIGYSFDAKIIILWFWKVAVIAVVILARINHVRSANTCCKLYSFDFVSTKVIWTKMYRTVSLVLISDTVVESAFRPLTLSSRLGGGRGEGEKCLSRHKSLPVKSCGPSGR